MFNDTSPKYGRANLAPETVARGIGWLSVGLGAAKILAPSAFCGREGSRRAVELLGVIEIATGVCILAARDKTPGLCVRLGRDVLGLATLAAAWIGGRKASCLTFMATAAAAGADLWCIKALAFKARPKPEARDYSTRSGFPKPAAEMRGTATRTPLAG